MASVYASIGVLKQPATQPVISVAAMTRVWKTAPNHKWGAGKPRTTVPGTLDARGRTVEAWTWLAPCCRDDGLWFYHWTVGPFDGARPFALVFGLSDFGGFGTGNTTTALLWNMPQGGTCRMTTVYSSNGTPVGFHSVLLLDTIIHSRRSCDAYSTAPLVSI